MQKFINTIAAAGMLAMAATPLLAIGSFANAAEPQARILVSDLDMGSAAGRNEFARRADAAADRLCSKEARDINSLISRKPACKAAVVSALNTRVAATATAQAFQVAAR